MNGPTIVTRNEWGARAPQGTRSRMSSYDGLIVHHTVGAMGNSLSEGKEIVQGIQRLHQNQNGWIDIGYNFLIDGAGHIYEGRGTVGADLARGAHAPDFNATRIGIALMGCFHPPEAHCSDEPSVAQLDSLVALCRFLIVRFWIKPTFVTGHRDHRQTACPGDTLFAKLPEIRNRIGGSFTLEIAQPSG